MTALGLIDFVGPGNGAREASLAAPAIKIIPAQGVTMSRFKNGRPEGRGAQDTPKMMPATKEKHA